MVEPPRCVIVELRGMVFATEREREREGGGGSKKFGWEYVLVD